MTSAIFPSIVRRISSNKEIKLRCSLPSVKRERERERERERGRDIKRYIKSDIKRQ
jgi:hypothetical protein